MAATLPTTHSLSKVLTTLLDRKVVASAAKVPLKPDPKSPVFAAVYVGKEGKPIALCLTDLAFAIRMGAALSMLPAGAATESIQKSAPSESMMENYAEVMNVISFALSGDGEERVVLRGQPAKVETLAADARSAVAKAKRAEFDVDIQGYGVGKIAVLAA